MMQRYQINTRLLVSTILILCLVVSCKSKETDKNDVTGPSSPEIDEGSILWQKNYLGENLESTQEKYIK